LKGGSGKGTRWEGIQFKGGKEETLMGHFPKGYSTLLLKEKKGKVKKKAQRLEFKVVHSGDKKK